MDWHPQKALLVSGRLINAVFSSDGRSVCLCISIKKTPIQLIFEMGTGAGAKDNLVKLWDAKTGRVLCTL